MVDYEVYSLYKRMKTASSKRWKQQQQQRQQQRLTFSISALLPFGRAKVQQQWLHQATEVFFLYARLLLELGGEKQAVRTSHVYHASCFDAIQQSCLSPSYLHICEQRNFPLTKDVGKFSQKDSFHLNLVFFTSDEKKLAPAFIPITRLLKHRSLVCISLQK